MEDPSVWAGKASRKELLFLASEEVQQFERFFAEVEEYVSVSDHDEGEFSVWNFLVQEVEFSLVLWEVWVALHLF